MPTLSIKRLVFVSSLSQIVSKMAFLGVQFLTLGKLYQAMGKEDYALFALGMTIFLFFGVFDFGVGGALQNRLSALLHKGQKEEADRIFFSSVFWLSSVCLALFVVSILGCSMIPLKTYFHIPSSKEQIFFYLLLSVTFLGFLRLPLQLSRSYHLALDQSLLLSVLEILGAGFTLWLSYQPIHQFGFLPFSILFFSLQLFASVAAFYAIVYRANFPKSFWKISFDKEKAFLQETMQFWLLSLFPAAFLFWIPVAALHHSSLKEFAIFSSYQRLFNLPIVLFIAMSAPFWPSFTRAYLQKETKWIQRAFFLLAIAAGLAAICFTSFMLAFDRELFLFWFKEQIHEQAYILAFGAFSLLWSLVIACSTLLNAIQKLSEQIYAYFVMGIGFYVLQLFATSSLQVLHAANGAIAIQLVICLVLALRSIQESCKSA